MHLRLIQRLVCRCGFEDLVCVVALNSVFLKPQNRKCGLAQNFSALNPQPPAIEDLLTSRKRVPRSSKVSEAY